MAGSEKKKQALTISPDEYKKQLKNINLSQILVAESKSKFDYLGKNVFLSSEFDPQFNLDHKTDYRLKDNSCIINSKWSLEISDKSDKEYLNIEAEYVVFISSKKKLSHDFWDIYKSTSIPLIVYPYFREFVQTTSYRMNIPPLTLPIIFK